MTINEILKKGMIELKSSNIAEPKLKARLLLQYVLEKSRQYILVYDNEKVTEKQEKAYFSYINKLKKGTPLQHITHQQEFMKMNFYVDNNVLIPRPDTENLVEEVIEIAKKTKAKKILDICTGSGAIAISLAKYIEKSEITAVDISSKALKVAKHNAKKNEVENQITFVESDLFEKLPKEKYDIIVSNPPYIKKEVIKTLDEEVKQEPEIALDGGEDGLDFYRKLVREGYDYLKFKGYLCLEIGYDQKEEVIDLINKEEKYEGAYCKKDLYDNDRVVVARVK